MVGFDEAYQARLKTFSPRKREALRFALESIRDMPIFATKEMSMSVQDRIKRYRSAGGAADLVRVEVLVPPGSRDEILSQAAAMRSSYRQRRARLEESIEVAVMRYGVRVLDNIDLSRLASVEEKARVLAQALMARGDVRAFAAGRKLLEECAA
jgi:hypothetical protein